MDTNQKLLLGALVGLARATDGNEHLITERITAVITQCLFAVSSGDDRLQYFIDLATSAKRELVPDCFKCANPCGRTSPYDLSELERAPADIQEVKYRILRSLLEIAKQGTKPQTTSSLYRGLILIGLDGYSAAELNDLYFRNLDQ